MRQPSAPRAPRTGPTRTGAQRPPDPRAPRGADLVIPADELADLHADWDEPVPDDDAPREQPEVAPGRPDRAPRAALPGRAPVSQLDDRLAERRRARSRVLWTRIGIGVGVLLLLVGAVWAVGFSSLLALRSDRIVIAGEGAYLDRDAAVAVVEEAVGTPLVRLDTAGIAARLEERPDVADAVVTRDWPGGVTATLTPREPVAVAAAADGGESELLDLVGPDGVVVASVAPDAAPGDLPLLTVDMTQDGAQDTVLAVLSVLDQLPPELREQVRDAGATSPDAIELRLHSGSSVGWGSAAESDLKARVLLTLLQVPATRYDVSAPEAPTTS
ncbi:cell division protein FtsQ [Salana multivorans]|uniref:Cell division protein FtsQ n=2 Tax=Salana multivorans TaxID=120377 RepID=A0A3N2D240_9MICO|nr:cell division protein FtsQ/DivIB [Salana multivorans]ROR93840.1 cell division protein FtsQ [Salana multivorans]